MSRNDAGFAVDTNIVTIIGDDGRAIEHPKLSKHEVADVILDRLAALRRRSPASARCAPFARRFDS